MSRSKVLFQLTGSIACFKACAAISKLVQAGLEVQAVATASALQFVGKATLEGLTGKPVFTDVFEPGKMMDHIHLARWADVAIICPATASSINRIAHGLGDDVVGALFLAYELEKKPYLIAPAMNHQMLRHPATQSALARLETWGVRILPTGTGHQACGEEGEGRLLEPERILEAVSQALEKTASKGPA